MYKCKKCQASEYTKARFVKGEQRYKSKNCGCQFVPTRHKGEVCQKSSWQCDYTLMAFRLEQLPSY